MKKLNGIQGMHTACQALHRLLKSDGNESTVIGIAGPVASGKTRFTQELIRQTEVLGQRPVIPLPFDLWINPRTLKSKTYSGRFFLDDFGSAVRCAKNKLHFLIPRYDLQRQGWVANSKHAKPTTQTVFWEGRIFNRIEPEENICLPGSSGTYLENKTDQAYSFFPNDVRSIYVTDGTLIAQKELREFYDLLIFVTAPWVNRVANMVRRFNRNEVFGSTSGAMAEYVEFLVDEARSCADMEIFDQLNQDIIKIEYSPMTLSNYLDLWYLKELIPSSTQVANWVKKDEVDHEINQFIRKLREEYDPATLEDLRSELEHLVLAKHLLCLDNKDNVLKELSSILN